MRDLLAATALVSALLVTPAAGRVVQPSGIVTATEHVPPTYASSFHSEVRSTLPDAGVSALKRVSQDGPSARLLVSNYSSQGSFFSVLLADQKIYIPWLSNNGTVQCVYGPKPIPALPGPSLVGATYLGTSGGPCTNGLCDRYQVPTNQYLSTSWIDSKTKLFTQVSKTEVGLEFEVANYYVNGTANAEWMTVPEACKTTSSATSRALHADVFTEELQRASKGAIPTQLELRTALHHTEIREWSHKFKKLQQPGGSVASVEEAVSSLHKHFGGSIQLKNASAQLPSAVDNRVYATPVRNQGFCGACWSFGTLAAIEVIHRKAKNLTVPTYNPADWFSVQEMLDCVPYRTDYPIPPKGCQGGWPGAAAALVMEEGVVFENDYPFQAVGMSKCNVPASATRHKPLETGFYLAAKNVTGMEWAVSQYGAVSAVLNFYVGPLGPAGYPGGIYNQAACTPGLSHNVAILGYGTQGSQDYWIIKNSLGAGWGEAGYMRIAKGINMCGIEDVVLVMVPV